MSHADFLKAIENNETKQAAFIARIRKDHPDNIVDRVASAFGEKWGTDGWVEQKIRNQDGMFVKLYGCSYLLKGSLDGIKLNAIKTPKSMVSEIPMRVIGKDWLLSSVLIFRAIFTRKKFIALMDQWFDIIMRTSIVNWEIPETDYSLPIRELRRAGYKVIKDIYGIDASIHVSGHIDNYKTPGFPAYLRTTEKKVGWLLARILRFFTFLLQYDSAYRYRVQDAFGSVTSKGLQAFYEGIGILSAREKGVQRKIKFVRWAIGGMFLLYPEFKRFAEAYFNEVDLSQLKPDEADIYFMQGYYSYDFEGKSFEDRQKERKQIDQQKGHVMLCA